jgi:hypothetical protein
VINFSFFTNLKHHSGNNNQSQRTLTLFKSLALIMGIQIGGWTLTIVLGNLSSWLEMVADQRLLFSNLMNCLSSLSSTIEVPAIYFTRCLIRQKFFNQNLFPTFPALNTASRSENNSAYSSVSSASFRKTAAPIPMPLWL